MSSPPVTKSITELQDEEYKSLASKMMGAQGNTSRKSQLEASDDRPSDLQSVEISMALSATYHREVLGKPLDFFTALLHCSGCSGGETL